MVIWALVILVMLMIPLLAIVIDSEFGRAFGRRISADEVADAEELTGRIDQLEGEVRYLTESLQEVREETGFLRSLLGEEPTGSRGLPPGD
jgi:hypothetical protein